MFIKGKALSKERDFLLERIDSDNTYKTDVIDRICTVLILAFYWLRFLATVSGAAASPVNTYISFVIGIAAGVIAIIGKPSALKTLTSELRIFSLLIVCLLLSSVYNGNMALSEIIIYAQFIFLSLCLFRIRMWHIASLASALGITGFCILQIARGVSPDSVMVGVSRNSISIYIMVFVVLYYISLQQNGFKPNIYIASLAFLSAIWGGGRSGIYALALFLAAVVIGRYLELKYSDISVMVYRRMKYGVFLVVGLIAVIAYMAQNGDFVDSLLSIYRAKSSVNAADDIRFTMIAEYASIAVKNIWSLLLGVPLGMVKSMQVYNGNPHNMYINLHAQFGLIPFIAIMVLCVNAAIKLARENVMWLLIFISLLFRGFSDIVGFYGVFDPLIFWFVWVGLNVNQVENGKKL
ncbi:MAG: hypothetical protein ACYCYI_07560 [Saccharofermentanales bacterium]